MNKLNYANKQFSLLLLLILLLQITACATTTVEPVAANSEKQISAQNNKPEQAETEVQKENGNEEDVSKLAGWEKQDALLKQQRQNLTIKKRADIRMLKKNFDLSKRMPFSNIPGSIPLSISAKRYDFKIPAVDISLALKQFSQANNIDFLIDNDIDGEVSANFKDATLSRAMELLLGGHNYYWEWDNGVIHVSRLQTKIFVLDYLRLVRSGNAFNSTSIATSTQAEKQKGSTSNIEQSDNLAFWEELSNQLSTFVSEQGRLVINRLSGTIQVTDMPTRIKEMTSFLDSLESALYRQVEIDARIMEVSLRDDHSLGVDWSKISIKAISGALTSTITDNSSIGLKASTVDLSFDHKNFTSLISALEEQGTVNIVSQPRIRAMNNQPSLIKVGTDRTFFTQTLNMLGSPGGVRDTIITDEPKTITEGLVLSLTPQISKDRWVMLDISPIITRVVETTTSSQGSTAPVLDVKQASTLVRARDGEMIILGGLIQEDNAEAARQVPWFAKLPFIGKVFQGNYTSKTKKELVIFLVPRLVI